MGNKYHSPNDLQDHQEEIISGKLPRRTFLRFAGATTATAFLLTTGCQKVQDELQDILNHNQNHGGAESIDLGSGDLGVLNYAYVLEQLEAAFYTWVIASPFKDISSKQYSHIDDVRKHEVAHREFFKAALGSHAVGKIKVDFSKIDFTSRESVLGTAKAFEDLGVSAYNGAGQLLQTADYLVLAGKIVSVEARHAAYFRDLVKGNSFADSSVVNGMGLDTSRMPPEVLTIAQNYIKTKIDGSHLPTA